VPATKQSQLKPAYRGTELEQRQVSGRFAPSVPEQRCPKRKADNSGVSDQNPTDTQPAAMLEVLSPEKSARVRAG